MSALNYNDTINCSQDKVDLSYLVLSMLICVLAVLGNTLVLVATWREKSLHEPNKYFIACLATADLFVGMFSLPISFLQHFKRLTTGDSLLNPALCRFHLWIDAFAETASIYLLTFISFDRYLKICKPLHYRSRMTTCTSLKVILVIFLISITYAMFRILPYNGCYTFDKVYFTFIVIAAFLLPIIVIVIMYALIFRAAHRRQKMVRNGELGQRFNDQNRRVAFLEDLKLIRMLAIVVGAFIICWGPFFICLITYLYKPELFDRKGVCAIFVTLSLLPPMNSLCNPIIYACLDQKYKDAFKHLFQKLKRRPISRSQEPPNAMELGNNVQSRALWDF